MFMVRKKLYWIYINYNFFENILKLKKFNFITENSSDLRAYLAKLEYFMNHKKGKHSMYDIYKAKPITVDPVYSERVGAAKSVH